MTEQFARKMEEGVKPLGYPFKRKAAGAVLRLFPVSGGKNKVMNLTAITEEDAVITKHFL